eukprot:scaffold53619_cov63-Phaeocystis_antarctica.AAC.2
MEQRVGAGLQLGPLVLLLVRDDAALHDGHRLHAPAARGQLRKGHPEGGGEPRREDELEVGVQVEVVDHGAVVVAAARVAARGGRAGVAQHVAVARLAQRRGEGLEASPRAELLGLGGGGGAGCHVSVEEERGGGAERRGEHREGGDVIDRVGHVGHHQATVRVPDQDDLARRRLKGAKEGAGSPDVLCRGVATADAGPGAEVEAQRGEAHAAQHAHDRAHARIVQAAAERTPWVADDGGEASRPVGEEAVDVVDAAGRAVGLAHWWEGHCDLPVGRTPHE